MKRTLKAKREYLKATENLFAVYSFVNGKRESGYSSIGLIDAFEEVAKHIAAGKQVIIALGSSDKEITSYEIKNKCRIPYEIAKKFAVRPDFNGDWKQV